MGKYRTIALIAGIFIAVTVSSCYSSRQLEAGSHDSEVLAEAKQTLPIDVSDHLITKFKTAAEGITHPKTADDFFLIAYYADLSDNLDSAKKYYSKAIELKHDYAEAYLNMGTLYAYEKDVENSIKSYEKAIELKPDNKNNAYSCIVLGYLYYGKENYSKGDAYFGKIVEYMEDKAEANFGLGLFYYQDMEDIDKAIEYYKKAIELKPDYAAAYTHMGVAYADKDDYDKALEYHKKAVELDSNYAAAYSNMGYAYYYKKDYGKAIESYKEVVKLEPDNAEVYLNIGASYDAAYGCKKKWEENCDKAIEYYKKAAELRPRSAIAFFDIGVLYEQKQDWGKAIEYLEKAVDLNSSNTYVYSKIGDIYSRKKDYKQAVEYYERVIELDPDSEAYGNAASAYIDEMDYDQAIEYYEKALEMNPSGICTYYNNIGVAYYYKRDNNKAEEYFKKAMELRPNCASLYNNMGEISFYKKDYDKTIEYCKKAVELDSSLAESYYYMGEALEKKGDKKKGEEYKKKAKHLEYVYESPELKKVPLESASEKLKKKFTDSRDGKAYKYVQIGKQTWMAENLNHKTDNSWCYNNEDSNCEKYGRIYDWASATKICPSGWHLPSEKEWQTLIDFAGGKENAGKKLKAHSGWEKAKVWNEKKKLKEIWKTNGSDDFGFSALPGGARISFTSAGGQPAYYSAAGSQGSWWTSTEYEEGNAWRLVMALSCNEMGYPCDDAATLDAKDKNVLGFSVRCIKN